MAIDINRCRKDLDETIINVMVPTAIKSLRHSREVADGGDLHPLMTPKGGRWWLYTCGFAQKHKALDRNKRC